MMTARLGALVFELTASTHLSCLETSARPLGEVDGEPVSAIELGGQTWLLIDHRSRQGQPCRVEYWTPRGLTEGPVGGLLVLCDAAKVPSRAEGSDTARSGHASPRAIPG